MGKKVILTESQFRDYMRSVKKQLNEQVDASRDLNIDEIEALLHKAIENEFNCYFKGGKVFRCAYLKDKGEILEAICSSFPVVDSTDKIRISNDKYGYFQIDNLIGAHL